MSTDILVDSLALPKAVKKGLKNSFFSRNNTFFIEAIKQNQPRLDIVSRYSLSPDRTWSNLTFREFSQSGYDW